jgi:F-type H+-transporting ATPase subunit delta
MEGIASRYALALLKIAQETSQVEVYLEASEQLLLFLKSDTTLIHFLGNEFYSKETKFKFLDQTFPVTTWFDFHKVLSLLVDKHRIVYLPAILQATIHLLRDALHQQKGIVYSVTPFTPDQLLQLQVAMQSHLGHALSLVNIIDPTLLGGFRIDIRGKIFDASIINKLASLKQQLLKRG